MIFYINFVWHLFLENYYYSGHQVIEVRDGNDQVKRQFIYGNGIDEVIRMDAYSGSTITPYYFHTNAIGSTTAVTDANGQVVERYKYGLYGMPTFMDAAGNVIPKSAIGNNILFHGREYETETNFYFFRARHYDPIMGRFLQVDPMGYHDSLNLYQAFNMNPVNFVDPFGLQRFTRKELEEKRKAKTLSGWDIAARLKGKNTDRKSGKRALVLFFEVQEFDTIEAIAEGLNDYYLTTIFTPESIKAANPNLKIYHGDTIKANEPVEGQKIRVDPSLYLWDTLFDYNDYVPVDGLLTLQYSDTFKTFSQMLENYTLAPGSWGEPIVDAIHAVTTGGPPSSNSYFYWMTNYYLNTINYISELNWKNEKPIHLKEQIKILRMTIQKYWLDTNFLPEPDWKGKEEKK